MDLLDFGVRKKKAAISIMAQIKLRDSEYYEDLETQQAEQLPNTAADKGGELPMPVIDHSKFPSLDTSQVKTVGGEDNHHHKQQQQQQQQQGQLGATGKVYEFNTAEAGRPQTPVRSQVGVEEGNDIDRVAKPSGNRGSNDYGGSSTLQKDLEDLYSGAGRSRSNGDGGSGNNNRRKTSKHVSPPPSDEGDISAAAAATAAVGEKKKMMGGLAPRQLGQNNPNAPNDAARVVSGTVKYRGTTAEAATARDGHKEEL